MPTMMRFSHPFSDIINCLEYAAAASGSAKSGVFKPYGTEPHVLSTARRSLRRRVGSGIARKEVIEAAEIVE